MWTELVLAAVILVQIVDAQINTNFAFPSFTKTDDGNKLIQVVSDASYNADYASYDLNALGNVSSNAAYTSCGRILWKDTVRMRAGTKVASFSTSFTFTFDVVDLATDPSYCGDGIAFTFVRYNNFTIAEYEQRRGGGLCLLDFHDTSPANRVFAVEFDSYNNNLNYSDPSDSHIGVDVNSTSLKTYDLCTSNFLGLHNNTLNQSCNFYCGVGKGDDFTSWIDYDSVAETLEVRFVVGGGDKPTAPVITVANLELYGVFDEDMFVGFSGSTGRSRRIHRIKVWNFTSSGLVIGAAENSNSTSKLFIGGVSAAAGVVVLLTGLLAFVLCNRWRITRSLENHELQLQLVETSRAFTFKELSRTTKNFSESELLSSGAFGDVYKGTLPSGTMVAVKRIKANKEFGEESFLSEATSLRQIRHRNLLQLRGWCHSKEGLLLVYDYMCNGSLDRWLHREFEALSWKLRRFILAGVASSLVYLHEEWVQCVLHRDIKSSNVMLDADFNPYLGDFGLARFVDHHKLEKTTLLAGTLGYMAPEMIHTGRATKETDVYAFGILVLEVVTGRRPLNRAPDEDPEDSFVLIDRVWHAHETGSLTEVADPRLFESQSLAMAESSAQYHALEAERAAIARVLKVGLLCCLPNPNERPSMRLVNQWFQANEGAAMETMPSLPSAQPQSKFSGRKFSEDASSSTQSSLLARSSSSYQASLSSARSSHRLAPR